jgi:hypothetical protein
MINWIQVVALTMMLIQAGCASRVDPTPEPTQPIPVSVGMLWWPADPSMKLYPFASEIERCLRHTITSAAPEIEITRREPIHDTLYPLMEPESQPRTEREFANLLQRQDVRNRLARNGLDYLVAFAGSTTSNIKNPSGGMICEYYGACFGFVWWNKTTALDAALWNLAEGGRPMREEASDSGTSMLPAFIFPVPIPAKTQSDACDQLGRQIAATIRSNVKAKKTE